MTVVASVRLLAVRAEATDDAVRVLNRLRYQPCIGLCGRARALAPFQRRALRCSRSQWHAAAASRTKGRHEHDETMLAWMCRPPLEDVTGNMPSSAIGGGPWALIGRVFFGTPFSPERWGCVMQVCFLPAPSRARRQHPRWRWCTAFSRIGRCHACGALPRTFSKRALVCSLSATRLGGLPEPLIFR